MAHIAWRKMCQSSYVDTYLLNWRQNDLSTNFTDEWMTKHENIVCIITGNE